MNLVNENNSIKFPKFKCLQTNKIYTITATSCTHSPKDKPYMNRAKKALDTLKRDDGLRKVMTRGELKERFKNVEEVKINNY